MFLEDLYYARGQTGTWKLVWKSEEGSQDLRPELPGRWVFGKDRESALARAKSAVSGWYICA